MSRPQRLAVAIGGIFLFACLFAGPFWAPGLYIVIAALCVALLGVVVVVLFVLFDWAWHGWDEDAAGGER